MAITLGAMRQYAADMAHDMADAKGDALAIYWIGQALEDLWRRHDWIHFQAVQRITLEPEVDGDDDLNVTLGSGSITRDTDWDSSWVTELWDLHVSGSAILYQLSAVSTTTATLATGQVWIDATATDQSYVLSRCRYSLPSNFVRRAVAVQNLSDWTEIFYVPPADFDTVKHSCRERSTQPRIYTLRGAGYVEFYPAPGTGYVPVQLTYTRKPTLPLLADSDATEVDWPEEYGLLLKLGIEVQAARAQGDKEQARYDRCFPELERAVLSARGLDTDKGHRGRHLSLGGRVTGGRGWSRIQTQPGGFTSA